MSKVANIILVLETGVYLHLKTYFKFNLPEVIYRDHWLTSIRDSVFKKSATHRAFPQIFSLQLDVYCWKITENFALLSWASSQGSGGSHERPGTRITRGRKMKEDKAVSKRKLLNKHTTSFGVTSWDTQECDTGPSKSRLPDYLPLEGGKSIIPSI